MRRQFDTTRLTVEVAPPATKPYTIFISHSNHDAEWVRQIAGLATQLGVRPYLFQDDPQPGHPVAEKLKAAIAGADAFMVVMTQHGGASPYVNQEVGCALGLQKPLIPIVEVGTPSDSLAFLRDVEYIPVDFADQSQAMTLIAGTIHRQVQQNVSAPAERAPMDTVLLGLAAVLVGLAVLALVARAD